MREFLHVDDMADAGVFVMNFDRAIDDQHAQLMYGDINVGSGNDITIKELANGIAKGVG